MNAYQSCVGLDVLVVVVLALVMVLLVLLVLGPILG
jgi:hypothetical protein